MTNTEIFFIGLFIGFFIGAIGVPILASYL